MAALHGFLLDSGNLPREDQHIEGFADLVCEAAAAIVSSMKDVYTDTGVLYALQFVMPYARSRLSFRTVAAIGTILECFSPTSDDGATSVLSLCRDLVERKKIVVFEGCIAFIMARYQVHNCVGSIEAATDWLVKGIEMESLILPMEQAGSCFRLLTSLCIDAALEVLQCIVDSQLDPDTLTAARSILSACGRGPTSVLSIPAVSLLTHILDVWTSIASNQTSAATSGLAHLLEKKNQHPIILIQSELLHIAALFLGGQDLAQRNFEGVAVVEKDDTSVLLELLEGNGDTSMSSKQDRLSLESALSLSRKAQRHASSGFLVPKCRSRGALAGSVSTIESTDSLL
jgi:hypothetical protein